MELDEIKTFFFDIDKTLLNWDETITGAEDLIYTLRNADRHVRLHTDNSILTRQQYAEKLSSMGIPAEEEEILTSSHVTARHLSKEGVTEVYAVGESGLIEELEAEGIEVKQDADRAVVGLDRQFNYDKLTRVKNIADRGGKIYLLSTEKTFRRKQRELPHQGVTNPAFRELGETVLTGKPGQIYRDRFREYFSYFPDRSLMVGDRAEDIETGNRLGMKTAAVMSGDLDKDSMKNLDELEKPDIGISHLSRIRKKII
jgi:HAD superfamily hydrolase (TIGR01450 family)